MFYSKTGANIEDSDNPHYDRFFVIGSKANSYIKSKSQELTALRQFNNIETIDYIFDVLCKLSKKTDYKETLSDYSNPDNLAMFKKKMDGISNKDDKLIIENFFLSFIHTLSSNPRKMNAHSVLISSTRDAEIAKKFSDNGFIIAFWIKNPIKFQAIDYNNITDYNELLEKYDFSKIKTIHFPDESEVTMFSCIFPHNIFYVIDLSNHAVVFNPYIVETDLQNILTLGINVDQSNFPENIKGIYSRSIWRCEGHLLYEKEHILSE